MRRFLPGVVVLFLAVPFAAPAAAQPGGDFPFDTVEARASVRAALQAIGQSPYNALESRAEMKRLVAELGKRHGTAPPLDEVKRLLRLMNPKQPASVRPVDLADLDHAPLQWAAFARQGSLRGPNPDLHLVQDHTWPAELTQGEKVALQVYSGNGAGAINNELRRKGTVPAMYAQAHERLQSAFRKARPFQPPVLVSRGLMINGKPQLDEFLKPFVAAHKEGKTHVQAGYVSTTLGPRVFPSFAGNVHVHIKATHGLDLLPISLYPEEREVLLNHNSTFRVTDVREENGKWIIRLEQVPPKEPVKKAA